MEATIDRSLAALYCELEKEASQKLEILKEYLKGKNEMLEAKVRFIQEDVEIRIESIKIELDQVYEEFKSKLEILKIQFIEDKLTEFNGSSSVEKYEEFMEELRSELTNQTTNNLQRYYKHENLFIKLQNDVYNLENSLSDFKLRFAPTESFKMKDIGEIVDPSKIDISAKELEDILEYSNYEIREKNSCFYDVCLLPNDRFLCANSNGSLKLLDNKFELIEQINRVDDRIVFPAGIAFDKRSSKLYVSDVREHCILMLDMNFKLIKSFGSKGSDNEHLNNPEGIYCHNEHVYVCDCFNERIQILNFSLEYVTTLKLDFRPHYLKISNTTIGISSNNGLYFFDLNSKHLKSHHSDVTGRISQIHTQFFVFSKRCRTICVYDIDGAWLADVSIKRLNDNFVTHWDGCISLVKNSLVVTSYVKRHSLRFEINK